MHTGNWPSIVWGLVGRLFGTYLEISEILFKCYMCRSVCVMVHIKFHFLLIRRGAHEEEAASLLSRYL